MNFRRGLKAFLPLVLMLVGSRGVEANTISYSSMSSDIYSSPLDSGGVTVTSAGTLAIQNGQGLGLDDGPILSVYPLIEDVYSATFTFDAGAADAVSFTAMTAAAGSNQSDDNFKITGYAVGGASLGTVEVNLFTSFPTYAVSSLFSSVPLSAFTISGDGAGDGGLNVTSITFSSAVPEPSTLLPTGFAGIASIWFASRRHRRAGSSQIGRI
jgi:hypothetical protein